MATKIEKIATELRCLSVVDKWEHKSRWFVIKCNYTEMGYYCISAYTNGGYNYANFSFHMPAHAAEQIVWLLQESKRREFRWGYHYGKG